MIRDLSIADSKLNIEGERGWELVSMCVIDANTARAYFKMQVEDTGEETAPHPDTAVVQMPGV